MSLLVDIRLKRSNKTYNEGEIVKGSVAINSPSDEKIEGLSLTLEGFV
jgi:hypothetical protein